MKFYQQKDIPMELRKVMAELAMLPMTPVGVDMGAHSVKAVSPRTEGKPVSFRSVYTTTARPPVFRDVLGGRVRMNDPMLEMNGIYTLFGEQALKNARAAKIVGIDPNERVKSGTTKMFFVGALSKLLPPGDYHVVAVLGLPVSDTTPQNVKEMSSQFTGYYEFYAPNPDDPTKPFTWRVFVSQVAVIEQPRGSVYDMMFNTDGTPTDVFTEYQNNVIAIVDNGGRTCDWLYMQPTEVESNEDGGTATIPMPVREFSGSVYAGTAMMIEILQHEPSLAPYVSVISPGDWDRIIREREFVNNTTGERVDLSEAIERARNAVASTVIEALRESLGGEVGSVKIHKVVVTGGAAWMIAKDIRKLYGAHRVVGPHESAWFTNVWGFYKLAKFFARR